MEISTWTARGFLQSKQHDTSRLIAALCLSGHVKAKCGVTSSPASSGTFGGLSGKTSTPSLRAISRRTANNENHQTIYCAR